VGQPLQQQRIILGLRGMRARKASGEDAGRAAECIYLKARIVRKYRFVRELGIIDCLENGVFLEGCAGFFGSGELVYSGQRQDFNSFAGSQRKLGQLVSIARASIQPLHGRAASALS
jgi:hypothetical protein